MSTNFEGDVHKFEGDVLIFEGDFVNNGTIKRSRVATLIARAIARFHSARLGWMLISSSFVRGAAAQHHAWRAQVKL